ALRGPRPHRSRRSRLMGGFFVRANTQERVNLGNSNTHVIRWKRALPKMRGRTATQAWREALMPQDGGWIQLVEVATSQVSVRAHLVVNEVTSAGSWRGRLESVRPRPLGAPLASGDYIALFGPWTEPHLVQVAVRSGGAPDIASD